MLVALVVEVVFLGSLAAIYMRAYDLLPAMTSASAKGIVVTTTVPGTSENAWTAFDKTFDGIVFHSAPNQTTGILQLHLPSAVHIDAFNISPQTAIPQRCPTHFSFEASRDGLRWVVLGDYDLPADSYQNLKAGLFRRFDLDSTSSYSDYRFTFKPGMTSDIYLTFSEISFLGQSRDVKGAVALLAFIGTLLIATVFFGSFLTPERRTTASVVFSFLLFSTSDVYADFLTERALLPPSLIRTVEVAFLLLAASLLYRLLTQLLPRGADTVARLSDS